MQIAVVTELSKCLEPATLLYCSMNTRDDNEREVDKILVKT